MTTIGRLAAEHLVPLALETIVLRRSDGSPFVYARVPQVERQFTSSMHSALTIQIRLRGWESESRAFLARRFPVARLADPDGGPGAGSRIRRTALHALDEGFSAVVLAHPDGTVTAALALPEPIRATIDLCALRHDLISWLTASGAATAHAVDEVDGAIAELATETYSGYLLRIGALSRESLRSGIVRAVVFGDDPACAMAH